MMMMMMMMMMNKLMIINNDNNNSFFSLHLGWLATLTWTTMRECRAGQMPPPRRPACRARAGQV